MPKLPTSVKVFFVLAMVATTLPIFDGYGMAFGLLCWLLGSGHWRLARVGRQFLPPPGAPDHELMAAYGAAVKPLHWGALALIVGHLLAALAGCALSPWSKACAPSVAAWSHMGVKLGLLWYVLSAAMIASVRLGWNPRQAGRWLLLWLGAQLAYCLVQHWHGIDWSHGLHAVLPPNRFAYGVYRVSGFMGHPLTFAYNHMLILLAALAMSWRLQLAARDVPSQRWSRPWGAVAALCFLTLLVSGSRYVLGVSCLAVVLCEARRLWRYRLWVALGAAAAVGVLCLDGAVIGRFGELFRGPGPLAERFPRLVFWQIHWQMFLDYPVTGVSMSGLDAALVAYYTAAGIHDNMYTAHNLFLQYLADTGLIGFSGLLLWFTGLFVARRRLILLVGRSQGLGYVAAATILCALMQNNLRDSAYLYAMWFYLSLLCVQSAVIHAEARRLGLDNDERKPFKNLQSGAGDADSQKDL